MNRTVMGLAIGAGYLLGRTRKLKLAIAVGTLVAGKRLNLSPGAVADMVSQQLKDNPQFKQIGDELRQDLRGVGKAASGALVERQMEALADRLHDRTAEVRDQLAGTVADQDEGDEDDDEREESRDADEAEDAADEAEDAADEAEDAADGDADSGGDGAPARRRTARKTPAKQSARQAPAKKAPARKAPAKKTAAKKTASRTASRAGRAGGRKGGGER